MLNQEFIIGFGCLVVVNLRLQKNVGMNII
jgi:hypothetical protein